MKHRTLAVITNLAAAVLLTTLVALGIYVTTTKHYVGRLGTNNYPVIGLDTAYWNVGCTIVGTTIGALAAVAFAAQDECLTRHELVAGRGMIAMFLRPLTVMRGGDQIVRRQLPLQRTLLVLLTLTTALLSATVVAIFGVRSVPLVVVDPQPSFPLALLDYQYFYNDKDGSVRPVSGNLLGTSGRGLLNGFLYKAAYIAGLKAHGTYMMPEIASLSEQGLIGSNVYETLYTGGIGLNVSSYLQYTGTTKGFSMPAEYSFNKLEATVFGTHVDVTCMNITSEYSINTHYSRPTSEIAIDVIEVTMAEKTGGPNFTLSHLVRDDLSLEIESSVVIDRSTSKPTLVFALGGLEALILGCTFTGREYRASVSVASVSSPLRLDHETDQGEVLSPIVQQHLANMSHTMFGPHGVGVLQAFQDAGFKGFFMDQRLISSLQIVLEQLGEAYFSYIRQQVEKSNVYIAGSNEGVDNGSRLQLHVTVLRLGGASYGWLAVPVALLLGTVIGVVRICRYRMLADFQAQDAVKLLQSTLQNAALSDTSRIEYKDGEILEIGGSQEIET
jgi:hypothetical protein